MALLLLDQNNIKTEFLNTFSPEKQKEATGFILRLSLE